jgi:hypothetical protein
MDVNWCVVCDRHIDTTESTLYCSRFCRDQDMRHSSLSSSISPFCATAVSPSSSIKKNPTAACPGLVSLSATPDFCAHRRSRSLSNRLPVPDLRRFGVPAPAPSPRLQLPVQSRRPVEIIPPILAAPKVGLTTLSVSAIGSPQHHHSVSVPSDMTTTTLSQHLHRTELSVHTTALPTTAVTRVASQAPSPISSSAVLSRSISSTSLTSDVPALDSGFSTAEPSPLLCPQDTNDTIRLSFNEHTEHPSLQSIEKVAPRRRCDFFFGTLPSERVSFDKQSLHSSFVSNHFDSSGLSTTSLDLNGLGMYGSRGSCRDEVEENGSVYGHGHDNLVSRLKRCVAFDSLATAAHAVGTR